MNNSSNEQVPNKTGNIESEMDIKISRGERRTLKAIENFSFKKLGKFRKVVFQKNFNSVFVIFNPRIYKNSKNGSFLIFGEVTTEKI
jgi:hypothetical protein